MGVDYDSSLNDNEIRSSIGLALDWFSPIGPMNFSISQPITKADGDKTETFRFNLEQRFNEKKKVILYIPNINKFFQVHLLKIKLFM